MQEDPGSARQNFFHLKPFNGEIKTKVNNNSSSNSLVLGRRSQTKISHLALANSFVLMSVLLPQRDRWIPIGQNIDDTCRRIGPVSSPSSGQKMLNPPLVSPSIRVQLMAEAPLCLGSREG